MSDGRIRFHIARLAAQLMYDREESEYFAAKRKAARSLGVEFRYRPGDLPSNREIRDQVQALARFYEGESRTRRLLDMRLAALRMMRMLARFRPRLIGSVLTGHIRDGSDIDLHLFSDTESGVTLALDDEGIPHTVEHKRVIKHNVQRVFTHIHVVERFPLELTVYPENQAHVVTRSSITGRPMERASIAELEALLRAEYPGIDLQQRLDEADEPLDRFELYAELLAPLEKVKQHPEHHPEGDALYHSLQVFELARAERSYDEEFLLAALLHDVGKAIDPADHVQAGLQALDGAISPRTEFLIRHHMDALALSEGTLGFKARQRLQQHEDFEDLMLLRQCDDAGRRRGVEVCTVSEALAFIRALDS